MTKHQSLEVPPTTLALGIVRAIEAYADDEALVTASGVRQTYRELGDGVREAIGVLRSIGCRRGDRVAIWLKNRPEWCYLQYACAILGAVIVPVNVRYRPDEVKHVLAMSGARFLFMQDRFLTNDLIGRLQQIAGGPIGSGSEARISDLPNLKSIALLDQPPPVGVVSYADLVMAGEQHRPSTQELHALARETCANDVLWMMFTSGSTSHPKGVKLDNHTAERIWRFTKTYLRYERSDRTIVNFPMYYAAGNFWFATAAHLHGATSIMGETFTAAESLRLCREEGVTVLAGTAYMLREIVCDPTFRSEDIRVRKAFISGQSIGSKEKYKETVAALGYTTLVQAYGMTELGGFVTSTEPDDDLDITLDTCGRALAEYSIRLIDPGTGAEVVGPGEGEAWVRGHRMTGYEGIPQAEQDLLVDAHGYFRTGDVLRRDADDRFRFVGRVKDMIKVGAENVAAAEIEALLKSHPAIIEAAVIGVPDERRGEIPLAFLETSPDVVLDTDKLIEWCKDRIAPFKVPRRFLFVAADDWPRAGPKIARGQLRERVR